MSTSSDMTVKRCVSSFARSRMSPTRRSSRCASSFHRLERRRPLGWIVDDALEQRRDVPADRGQRRAELVGDRHQEVPLHLLDLGEARRHLAESLAQVPELAGRVLRNLHVVVAACHRVGRIGELQHRPDDPMREVAGEQCGDEEAKNAGKGEPLDQVVDPRADVGLPRRYDDRADRVGAWSARHDRVRDRVVAAGASPAA